MSPHRWTKEAALEELRTLAQQSMALERMPRHSEDHTRWSLRVLNVLEDVFGRKSRYYLSFAAIPWAQTGTFIIGGLSDPEGSGCRLRSNFTSSKTNDCWDRVPRGPC